MCRDSRKILLTANTAEARCGQKSPAEGSPAERLHRLWVTPCGQQSKAQKGPGWLRGTSTGEAAEGCRGLRPRAFAPFITGVSVHNPGMMIRGKTELRLLAHWHYLISRLERELVQVFCFGLVLLMFLELQRDGSKGKNRTPC